MSQSACPPAHARSTALLVAGDRRWIESLSAALRRMGIRVVAATRGVQAIAELESSPPDALICHRQLEEGPGLELLETARDRWPAVKRILALDAADPRAASEAINKAGVCYLLEEPWGADQLRDAARAARLLASSWHPSEPGPGSLPGIIGGSAAMRELMDLVVRVAQTDSTVLITGETGTGKELIGRALHDASPRRAMAFSAVNSAAFPETLLESELFGHRRGSFTGATKDNKGLFESADRGTVFLDELGEMSLSMQAKLLRFLQTGEIRPLGSGSVRQVDVRLVAATNRRLEEEVEAGRFREDLYYRLAVIPIRVPPLRERIEDVPALAQHFLRRQARKAGRLELELDDSAMELLLAHDWPGNVRELENLVERTVALAKTDRIEAEDLPFFERRRSTRPSIPQPLESLPTMERRLIIETLDRVGWNRKRAAEILQISTTTLWRRLKEFGIDARSAAPQGACGE